MYNSNPNFKAPGKTFLQVTGILMVIFSSLGFIALLLGGAILGATGGALAGVTGAAVGVSIIIMALIPCIFEFIVGILGIMNCNKVEKGKLCLILGIILIVLEVISLFATFSFMNLLFMAIPICYIIGAYKNDVAYKTM